MPGKFCVSLTFAKENTDKATVAFVIATAAVASDKEAVVFLKKPCASPKRDMPRAST
jgi:uncharacterized protein